jgi:hypothetical protein
VVELLDGHAAAAAAAAAAAVAAAAATNLQVFEIVQQQGFQKTGPSVPLAKDNQTSRARARFQTKLNMVFSQFWTPRLSQPLGCPALNLCADYRWPGKGRKVRNKNRQ